MHLALLVTLALAAADDVVVRPTGLDCHGAGGPFIGAIGLFPGAGAPLLLVTSGGYGYSYFLGGHLRVGGGGQGTLGSGVSAGRTGSLGWGSIHVGYDPLADGPWEFPFAISLGGGRLAVERVLDSGLVERASQAFFAMQASASVEYRLARTIKLALMASYLAGVNETGLAFQAVEGSLRLVFLLPLPEH
jgi:hypothetical protein